MTDVLTIADLEADKKHSTFFAEVITGKMGGIAGGADIDTATNQVTGQMQKTTPKVLADLGMQVQIWGSTAGGTLTNLAQVFLNDTVGSAGLGNYYAWSGIFPKTVTPGLDPAITAGFIQRSDAGLRQELNVVVKTFNTVAEMKADSTLIVGQKCKTIGYNNVLDGGGNEYSIVASGTGTNDGGKFIDLSGSGFQAEGLFPAGFADVKKFGAKGDGVNDDASAIQAAVNSGYRSIFFPTGVYLITTPINISSSKIGLRLYGSSKSNSTACILTNNDIEMFQERGIYTLYEGLAFNCNFAAHSKRHIQCYSAEHPSFVNCVFNGIDNQTATGSGIGFGDGAGGVGGTMGIVDRCIFNHGSIDVKTWDVHITNSWVWANSRAYAIRAVGSIGNLLISNTDIVPPVLTRSDRKSGIYLSGAVTQPVISSCYIDGNPVLATGVGILAEDGVIGLSIDSLRANANCQEVIILDSVINPIVKGCTFMGSNRAGLGSHTILLQQTKTQAMLNPVIVNNSFVQTAAVSGTPGSAICVNTGVSRNKIKIEDNVIYQPGAGGGFADQEINLAGGAFGDKQQGSLRGNATTRKKCSVSAAATFTGSDTFVTIPLNAGGALMYAPRIDQIRVNCSVALPYAVQLVDASSVRINFTAGGASGAFYVSVELD